MFEFQRISWKIIDVSVVVVAIVVSFLEHELLMRVHVMYVDRADALTPNPDQPL